MVDLKYKIISGYQNNHSNRNEFYKFISIVFPGISFKEWFEKGFWTKKYIPYSITKNDEIISNVCVTMMDVLVHGQKKKAIQIGAVGTIPEYRNQGLSRKLMKIVLAKYLNKVDFFFLYANESVLDYYPKFGFKSIEEYQFTSHLHDVNRKNVARRLKLNNSSDLKLIRKLINKRILVTKEFGATQYTAVTWWHILNTFRNDLHYLKEFDTIVIKKEDNGTLHIYDIICKDRINIDKVISKIGKSRETKTIKYYFPPDQFNFGNLTIEKENTGLYVLGNIEFGRNPFRFPETAIT